MKRLKTILSVFSISLLLTADDPGSNEGEGYPGRKDLNKTYFRTSPVQNVYLEECYSVE